MNINEWMLENKLAFTVWQAGHINEGLQLWKCKTFDEQKERVMLYRKWRPLTETKKSKLIPTKQAYDLVIAGIDPADVQERQIELPQDFIETRMK